LVNRTKVGQKPESKQDVVEGKEGVSGGENIAPSLEEQISRRAYELYEQRGKEHGRADEDWLRAEREILEGVPSNTNPTANEVE
jgi:hypothetical protein